MYTKTIGLCIIAVTISLILTNAIPASLVNIEYNEEFEKQKPEWTVKWDNQKSNNGFSSVAADIFSSVAADIRGNYIYVAGSSFQGDDSDLVLQKYDIKGNRIWSKVVDTGASELGRGVAFRKNAIYLISSISNSTYFNSIVQKFDQEGNLIWSKLIGSDHVAIALDTDRNFIYVTGRISKLLDPAKGTITSSVFLQKYDMNGNLQWGTTWGLPGGNVETRSIVVYRDSMYVTGEIHVTQGSKLFLLKYTKTGELVWEKVNGEDYSVGVDLTAYGGKLYIIGTASEILSFDLEGNQLWKKVQKEIGAMYIDGLPPISTAIGAAIVGYKGHLYVVGHLDPPADLLLQKYDLEGNLLNTTTWDCCEHRYFRDPENIFLGQDAGKDVVIFRNSIYVVGETFNEDSHFDALLQKYKIHD